MKLQILRDGQELGSLTAADARELLVAGFLKPTDEFQFEREDQRQLLAALLESKTGGTAPWLARAKSSVALAGQTVQTQATNLKSRLSGLVLRHQTTIAKAATRLLEDSLPQLRKTVGENLGTMAGATEAALRDETFLRKLFGAVYDCMPKPVCRFVNETAFAEFCLKHRHRLLP